MSLHDGAPPQIVFLPPTEELSSPPHDIFMDPNGLYVPRVSNFYIVKQKYISKMVVQRTNGVKGYIHVKFYAILKQQAFVNVCA